MLGIEEKNSLDVHLNYECILKETLLTRIYTCENEIERLKKNSASNHDTLLVNR